MEAKRGLLSCSELVSAPLAPVRVYRRPRHAESGGDVIDREYGIASIPFPEFRRDCLQLAAERSSHQARDQRDRVLVNALGVAHETGDQVFLRATGTGR